MPTKDSEIITRLHGWLPIGVITIHAYWQSDVYDIQQHLQVLLSQGLFRVTIPIYFLIAGYLYFNGLEVWNTQTYLAKLRRRCLTLLVPYLLWNLVALVVGYLMALGSDSVPSVYEYLRNRGGWLILWHPPNFPLWFLRDLMIMAVAAPLVMLFVKYLRWPGLALLAVLYVTHLWPISTGFSAKAVLFFSVGCYLRLYTPGQLLQLPRRWKITCYITATMLLLATIFTWGQYEVGDYLRSAFCVVGVAAVLNLLSDLYDRQRFRGLPKVCLQAALFIIATHTLGISTWVEHTFNALWTSMSPRTIFVKYLSSIPITYLLCLGIFTLLQHLIPRTLNLLVGGRIRQ